ncbi:conserved protein, unknown function [Hepatocystis sp. ex Piliocolobus tephrosceles]|nr:conserved protein, unknown function [Hepatocystis sp. ex Piliocolobus tephrosceles]
MFEIVLFIFVHAFFFFFYVQKKRDNNNIYIDIYEKSTEKSMPEIFNLFSVKAGAGKRTLNLIINENRNLWLRRILNSEKNRSMRKDFADFQEMRQNDISRFHKLLIIQNKQIDTIKNALLST